MVSSTTGNTETHKIVLHQDTFLKYPQLYLDVFVVGDDTEQRAFAEMFIRAGCRKAESIETADLVVFTGGADVNPALYGQTAHSLTRFHDKRDEEDMKVWQECFLRGIPTFGVCRGAQFLYVMLGGRLYQDIDNHHGDHQMWDHEGHALIPKVSSVHHQACIADSTLGINIVATTNQSDWCWENDKIKISQVADMEAFWCPDTVTFGVQGHPEYRGYDHFARWSLEKINKYVNENPDVVLLGGVRRIKPDLLEDRVAKRMEALATKAN